MNIHFWVLIKFIILFSYCGRCELLKEEELEYGPKPLDIQQSVITEQQPVKDEIESPKDVVSVSKFIKEFHKKKFQEESYSPERLEKIPEIKSEAKVIAAQLPSKPVDAGTVGASENVIVSVNETETNSTNTSTTFVNCNGERKSEILSVELVNSTRLLNLLTTDVNVTSKTAKAECTVLLFYARTCPFSCMAAPHFNALPRAFPAIKMAAVNVVAYQSFNTQYGIVGVPTVMLFHNGRPAAKFNDTEYTLEMFTRFITKYTGLAPEEKMFVTSADFGGPVPSVVAKETDYWLALAWTVIATVGGIAIGKSRAWRAVVEAIQNTWREAEAQHPHAE